MVHKKELENITRSIFKENVLPQKNSSIGYEVKHSTSALCKLNLYDGKSENAHINHFINVRMWFVRKRSYRPF